MPTTWEPSQMLHSSLVTKRLLCRHKVSHSTYMSSHYLPGSTVAGVNSHYLSVYAVSVLHVMLGGALCLTCALEQLAHPSYTSPTPLLPLRTTLPVPLCQPEDNWAYGVCTLAPGPATPTFSPANTLHRWLNCVVSMAELTFTNMPKGYIHTLYPLFIVYKFVFGCSVDFYVCICTQFCT